MCKNCNCDFFDRCSIVGYMPVGFCCENCYLYNEYNTCLKSKYNGKAEDQQMMEKLGELKLISASIEGGLLKVLIEHTDKIKKTILIDLNKYLQS